MYLSISSAGLYNDSKMTTMTLHTNEDMRTRAHRHIEQLEEPEHFLLSVFEMNPVQ